MLALWSGSAAAGRPERGWKRQSACNQRRWAKRSAGWRRGCPPTLFAEIAGEQLRRGLDV